MFQYTANLLPGGTTMAVQAISNYTWRKTATSLTKE